MEGLRKQHVNKWNLWISLYQITKLIEPLIKQPYLNIEFLSKMYINSIRLI